MTTSHATHRLHTTLLAALLPLAACGDSGASGGAGDRPNVLLITLDTTRPDRMSCYGGTPGLTPVIDQIAAEGARFERAISTAGITPMSHSSILTGLNNYKHGMRVFHSEEVSHELKESVDTLPELLKAKGYKTAAMVSSYPVSEHYNLDQGFDAFDAGIDVSQLNLEKQQRHARTWDTTGILPTQRRGDLTTTQALGWLDENGKDGPWCMWLHMFDVHDFSIVPPPEFSAQYGVTYPANPNESKGGRSLAWREKIYDPELAFMDAQIGRLREWLKANGQDENTVIVITADHGQGLSDGYERHGWMKHRLLYDWSVRVPLIVRVPNGPSGAVVDAQVRTIDVVPTIMEAVQIPLADSAVEGRSVLALAAGGSESEPRIAYADALNLYDAHAPPARTLPANQKDNLYMACDGRWKLIHHERNPEHSQLYDLLNDPKELSNLFSPDHEQALRLMSFLQERQVNRMERPGENSSGDAGNVLNQLGYGGEAEELVPQDPTDIEPEATEKPQAPEKR